MASTLVGCMGYMPGLQTYWDSEVRELCAKDGGVKIFEHIVVSPTQAQLLPKVGDFWGVAPEKLAKPYEPAFTRTRETVLREFNPSVINWNKKSYGALISALSRLSRAMGGVAVISLLTHTPVRFTARSSRNYTKAFIRCTG